MISESELISSFAEFGFGCQKMVASGASSSAADDDGRGGNEIINKAAAPTDKEVGQVKAKEVWSPCNDKVKACKQSPTTTEEPELIRPEDIKVEVEFVEGSGSVDMDPPTYVHLEGDHILKHIIDSDEPTDVILSLEDGKLSAHRMVLAASSPLLNFLLSEHDQKLHNIATLIIPNVNRNTMKILLNLAYTGKMNYCKSEEQDVLQAMDLLKFAEYGNLNLIPRGVKRRETVNTEVTTITDETNLEEGATPRSSEQEPSSSTTETTMSTESTPSSDHRSKHINFLRRDKIGCNICKKYFSSMTNLMSHLERAHKQAWLELKTTDEELRALTFCNVCGQQLKSIQVANKCLAKHNMVRCYICLDAIKKSEHMEHYKSLHTKNEDMKMKMQTFCRWCSRVVSYDSNARHLLSHCTVTHFQEGHVKKVVGSTSESVKRKIDGGEEDGTKRPNRHLQVVLRRISDDILEKCIKRSKALNEGEPVTLAVVQEEDAGGEAQLEQNTATTTCESQLEESEASELEQVEEEMQVDQSNVAKENSSDVEAGSTDDECSANCTTESESEPGSPIVYPRRQAENQVNPALHPPVSSPVLVENNNVEYKSTAETPKSNLESSNGQSGIRTRRQAKECGRGETPPLELPKKRRLSKFNQEQVAADMREKIMKQVDEEDQVVKSRRSSRKHVEQVAGQDESTGDCGPNSNEREEKKNKITTTTTAK